MIKRTRTIIETYHVQIIRSRKPEVHEAAEVMNWCEACSANVRMITPEEAAAIAEVTTRTIYRWVDAAELHFTEMCRGSLFVCLESLTLKQRRRIEK